MQRARAYLCYDRANGPQDNRALPSFPEHSRLSPHARNACGRVRWPRSNQNHKAYGWARCAPRRIPSAQLRHGTHRRPPCVRPPPLTRRKGQGSASSKEVKRLPGGPRSAASPTGPQHPHLGALGSIPRTASPVARRIDERIASRRELVDGGKPVVPKTTPPLPSFTTHPPRASSRARGSVACARSQDWDCAPRRCRVGPSSRTLFRVLRLL